MEFTFDEENRIIIDKSTGEQYIILPTFRLEHIFRSECQISLSFQRRNG
jgi:hypothetical protein